jgi:hypothetical protein
MRREDETTSGLVGETFLGHQRRRLGWETAVLSKSGKGR